MTMTTAAPSARPRPLRPDFDRIPAALRASSAWVLWRYEATQRGTWAKVPYQGNGRKASTTEPAQWATFDHARRAYTRGGYGGVGIVVTDDFAGIDLDKCVTESGEAEPWAAEVLERFKGTYRERSPSGKGYRIFLRGAPRRCGKGGPGNRVEVYAKGSPRYLTLTGHALDDVAEVAAMQPALDWLHGEHMAKTPQAPPAPVAPASAGADAAGDDEVLDRARRAHNGAKFRELWAGGHAGHASASEADAALVGLLGFYTRDAAQIDRLFRRSGLHREKWDERRGATTYGALTIARILAKPGAHFGDGAREATGGATARASGPNVGPPHPADDRAPAVPLPLPELPPVPAFPLDLLPEAFRAWVADAAERAGFDPAFMAVGAMVAAGSLLGRRLGIRLKAHDDWTEYPNLWGAIVGTPSTMKSPAMLAALKPVKRLQVRADEWHASAVAEWRVSAAAAKLRAEAAKKRAGKALERNPDAVIDVGGADTPPEPIPRAYWTSDATVEKLGEMARDNPHGLLIVRDELSALLKSLDDEQKAEARGFYLSGWSGKEGYRVDRIGRGTTSIPAYALSVFGGIQPGPLARFVREAQTGERADGLLQRLQLLVWPDAAPFEYVDRDPLASARDAVFDLFERLDAFDAGGIGQRDAFGEAPPFLRLCPEAQAGFKEWHGAYIVERRQAEQGGAEPGPIAAHFGKFPGLVGKLALLLHVCDDPAEREVSARALSKALAWVRYLTAHAQRVYHAVHAPEATAARLLLARLRAGKLPARFKPRELYRNGWHGLTDPETVKRACRTLHDYGWLLELDAPALGGRPADPLYTPHPLAGMP